MLKTLRSKDIEIKIASVACSIAIIRVIYAAYSDLLHNDATTVEYLVHLSILILMVAFYFLIISEKYSKLGIVLLSTLLTVFLGSNWLMFGGMASQVEFNFISWIVLLSMILMHRYRGVFMVLNIGLLFSLFYVQENNMAINEILFIRLSEGAKDYVVSVLGVLAIVFYLKFKLEKEHLILSSKGEEINRKIEKIESQNMDLEREKHTLFELQFNLENKVDERTKELNDRKEAVDSYLQLNIVGLQNPIQKIHNAISEMISGKPDDQLNQMMLMSADELLMVSSNIKKAIKDGGKIDRKRILGSEHS